MTKKPIRDNKLHLGYGPVTGDVYLGKQNNGRWIGEKRNVTDEFFHVMEQKFKVNTEHTIQADGKSLYRIIVVGMDKEVVITDKPINKED